MKSQLRRFDAGMGRLYEWIGMAVGISIGLFALAISLDLVLRLVGWGNLAGMQEIVEYSLFAGVFLTAPWLLRMGAHVRVDVLLTGLPRRLTVLLERLVDLAGIAICGGMFWFGWINLSDAYSFGSEQVKYFTVKEWWLLSVVVASFALLVVEFVIRFVRAGSARNTSGQGL